MNLFYAIVVTFLVIGFLSISGCTTPRTENPTRESSISHTTLSTPTTTHQTLVTPRPTFPYKLVQDINRKTQFEVGDVISHWNTIKFGARIASYNETGRWYVVQKILKQNDGDWVWVGTEENYGKEMAENLFPYIIGHISDPASVKVNQSIHEIVVPDWEDINKAYTK